MDIFFAGTVTVQYTSQTMLTHFIHKPDSLERAREQFKAVAAELYPEETYSLDRSFLDKTVTLDSLMDLEYLSRVVNEALRYESPASVPTTVVCLDDMQLGNYNFAKGDLIIPSFYGVHMNENEW